MNGMDDESIRKRGKPEGIEDADGPLRWAALFEQWDVFATTRRADGLERAIAAFGPERWQPALDWVRPRLAELEGGYRWPLAYQWNDDLDRGKEPFTAFVNEVDLEHAYREPAHVAWLARISAQLRHLSLCEPTIRPATGALFDERFDWTSLESLSVEEADHLEGLAEALVALPLPSLKELTWYAPDDAIGHAPWFAKLEWLSLEWPSERLAAVRMPALAELHVLIQDRDELLERWEPWFDRTAHPSLLRAVLHRWPDDEPLPERPGLTFAQDA
jgi:hypothetical protein